MSVVKWHSFPNQDYKTYLRETDLYEHTSVLMGGSAVLLRVLKSLEMFWRLILRVKETVNSVPGQAIPGYSVGAKLAAGGLVSLHVSRNPIQELPHADLEDSSFMDSTFQTKTEQVMFTEGVIAWCLCESLCLRDFSCSSGLQEKQFLLTFILSR